MLKNIVKNAKNNKGFTLIELIVVIAIIAILALILIPRFGGFRESAQTTADAATARTINSAVSALIVSNEITRADATESATIVIGSGTLIGDAAGDFKNISQDKAAVQGSLQKLLGTNIKRSFTVTIDASGNISVS